MNMQQADFQIPTKQNQNTHLFIKTNTMWCTEQNQYCILAVIEMHCNFFFCQEADVIATTACFIVIHPWCITEKDYGNFVKAN